MNLLAHMKNGPFILSIAVGLLIAVDASATLITPINHNWEASLDTNGNSIWEDIGSHAADAPLDFAMSDITRVATPGQGVTFTHAYHFSGTAPQMTVESSFAHNVSGGEGANSDSTFEMWVRLNTLPENNRGFVLFESGASGAGVSLTLRTDDSANSSIVATTHRGGTGTSSVSYTVHGVNDVGVWLQLALVLDITGGTQFAPEGTSTLYVNNADTKAQFSNGISELQNWGGTGNAALGYWNEGLADFPTASVDRFDGQISIFRFYEHTALSASEIEGNFAHVIPEPSTIMMTIFGTLMLLYFRRPARHIR